MSSGTIRACVFLCSRKPNLVIDLRNFLQATKNGRDIEQALASIKHGDYVIHSQYGIGTFEGLQSIEQNGNVNDFVVLNYLVEEIEKLF